MLVFVFKDVIYMVKSSLEIRVLRSQFRGKVKFATSFQFTQDKILNLLLQHVYIFDNVNMIDSCLYAFTISFKSPVCSKLCF